MPSISSRPCLQQQRSLKGDRKAGRLPRQNQWSETKTVPNTSSRDAIIGNLKIAAKLQPKQCPRGNHVYSRYSRPQPQSDADDERAQGDEQNEVNAECGDNGAENEDSNSESGDEEEREKDRDDRFYPTYDRFLGKSRPGKKARPFPARVDSIAPIAPELKQNSIDKTHTAVSFEEAAAQCRQKVAAIVKECRRLNVKYTDRLYSLPDRNALVSLQGMVDDEVPSSLCKVIGAADAKRVNQIFEKPAFYVDGIDANDIRQGSVGDCWFLAGIAAMSGMNGLLERICVDRDEKCGVYGFVFFRDGAWISVVVDDKLCVKHDETRARWIVNVTDGNDHPATYEWTQMTAEAMSKKDVEAKLKSSENLYFSRCRDPKETWLPLLEKAYAKAHGSYQAIEGGWPGEAIEDLTGGVTTMCISEDVLDTDMLWAELEQVNKKFLFGSGTRWGGNDDDYDGIVKGHAYTILKAQIYKGTRLLKIRNPWGEKEWDGAWSDGSKEWTADALKELGHTFGNDGEFYMCLEDFLRTYPRFDRTRLFLDPGWVMSQRWLSSQVPRSTSYYDASFLTHEVRLEVKKAGPVVVVLSIPDQRYFSGLEGRYAFELHFRICQAGATEGDYLIRSMSSTGTGRSCNAEIDLEPGSYSILIKLLPYRDEDKATAAEVIKRFAKSNREKVMETARQFDVAFTRGNLRKLEADLAAESKKGKRAEDLERRKAMKTFAVEMRKRNKMRQHRNLAETERKRKAKKAELREDRRTLEEAAAANEGLDSPEKERGNTDEEGWEDEDGYERKEEETEQKSSPEMEDKGDKVYHVDRDEDQGDDEDSDNVTVSSVASDDFAWDDDLDGPLACESDDEDEDEYVAGMPDCEFWDAIAVVGLRVYSMDERTTVDVHEP